MPRFVHGPCVSESLSFGVSNRSHLTKLGRVSPATGGRHLKEILITSYLPQAGHPAGRITSGLRASGAASPCGDFCQVRAGTREELLAVLGRAEAEIVAEGERHGGRDRGTRGQSVYVRDPDGNLLEFIRYV